MAKYDVWIRHVMDTATRDLVAKINPENRDVFEVSGDVWSDMFDWRSFNSGIYPDFDVCSDRFESIYDLIIAEQVFEHVRHPWRAARNIFSALRPGGYALITTPFMFHIHPTPLDCWRWTPQGMGFMLEDAGFLPEDIVTAGWGNIECFLLHALSGTAPIYDASRPLHNDPQVPVVVWGFARKS